MKKIIIAATIIFTIAIATFCFAKAQSKPEAASAVKKSAETVQVNLQDNGNKRSDVGSAD